MRSDELHQLVLPAKAVWEKRLRFQEISAQGHTWGQWRRALKNGPEDRGAMAHHYTVADAELMLVGLVVMATGCGVVSNSGKDKPEMAFGAVRIDGSWTEVVDIYYGPSPIAALMEAWNSGARAEGVQP